MTIFGFAAADLVRMLLILLLVVCAICASLSKKLLTTVIVYTSYSTVMALLWMLLQSPDLAITEAAVGAGVSTILFFLCLRKIGGTKADRKTVEQRPEGGEEKK